MQRTIFIVILLMFFSTIYATETEPNNEIRHGNYLAVIDSGKIGYTGDIDWWSVITDEWGTLSVIVTAEGGPVNFELYDNNGNLLSSSYTNTTDTISVSKLRPFGYQIKLSAVTPGELVSYVVSVIRPTDPPDNNTPIYGSNVYLNAVNLGRLNYYQNNVKDTVDWYQIQTKRDGKLRIHVISSDGLPLSIGFYYYSKNGLTLLSSDTASAEKDIEQGGLGKYAYYVKVNPFHDTTPGNYSIKLNLFSNFMDDEPNTNPPNYASIEMNGSTEGHINYYNTKDTADWFKIQTKSDGDLKFTLHPHVGGPIWASVYEADQKTFIKSTRSDISDKLILYELSKGDYTIQIKTVNPLQWATYTFSNHLFYYVTTDNKIPNNPFSQTYTIPANATATGYLNFIYPNPASTQFTIQYNPAKSTGSISLWLKNINGAVVWNKNNITATAAKGTVVDVSRLPVGIYLLQITDQNNHTVAVKKVVVFR